VAPCADDLARRIEVGGNEIVPKPSAASRTIFARMTSRYGDVYLRARASNAARFSAVSSMMYGLCLGVGTPPCHPRKVSTLPATATKYVTVFMRSSTKGVSEQPRRSLAGHPNDHPNWSKARLKALELQLLEKQRELAAHEELKPAPICAHSIE